MPSTFDLCGRATRQDKREVVMRVRVAVTDAVFLSHPADEALIFDPDHDRKWTKALAKLGVDASLLTAEAGRA